MGESVDLLFFDTFAHDNSEELNLDLVQFPKPVFVTEVRIIPLGARVQADFPGGVRLGATNPSQFSIEFFVNDLGKPGASTFESLGGFEYNQNGCINLDCSTGEPASKVPTDGLVLRGWYTTITLAVYGILTTNAAERIAAPTVTPSLPPQTSALSEVKQILPVGEIESEWSQGSSQPVPVNYVPQLATPYVQAYDAVEEFPTEYPEYYNDSSKTNRCFHNNEVNGDRDIDKYQKPMECEHRQEPDRRDRHYSRSHSQEKERTPRDYREQERDRDRDWDYDRNQSYELRDRGEKDWGRDRDKSKHQDSYRRPYARDDRDEVRKKPRTPPATSPRRPHTPISEHEETKPFEEEPINSEAKKGKTISPVNTPTVPATEDFQMLTEEFEPILSDEDIIDDIDHYQEVDDACDYGSSDDYLKLFVPGVTPLQKYELKSEFSITDGKLHIDENWKAFLGIIDDFLKSSITVYNCNTFEKLNKEIKEEFIHLCEKLMSIVDGEDQFWKLVQFYTLVKEANLNRGDEEAVEQIYFFVDTVIEWMKIALNFHLATTQNQPAYKIRHIKCGVRLVEWSCRSSYFMELLSARQHYIDRELLKLYDQEYMALSIKLMILRALDVYLSDKPAIENFLSGRNLYENVVTDDALSVKKNGYRMLISMVKKNPLVRLKFSLQSIIKKLNMYEILRKFTEFVKRISSDTNSEDEKKYIVFVMKTFEHILQILDRGCFVLSQPKRFLPVTSQFDINYSETKDITQIFKIHHVLECFCLLLTHHSTMNLPGIRLPICETLTYMVNNPSGLDYLSDNLEEVNVLLQCLLQNEEEMQYSISDCSEANAHYLGLEMAYKIQILYHVKSLLNLGTEHKFDCNHIDVIDELHALYCLTFTNVGKIACSEVLSMGDNINCLLQFIGSINGKEKTESQLAKLKKLPGWEYVIDLLLVTTTLSPNIVFLQKYSIKFMEIVNQRELFDLYIVKKLNEIADYLKVFENVNVLKCDDINPLITSISKNIDLVTTFPGEIISCLRVLQHLGVSKQNFKSEMTLNNSLDNYNELKYKHVVIQLFSLDGISLLIKILSSISDYYEQPALHTSTFISIQGIHIVNVIEPCIYLLKELLKYIIHSRNVKFKDLSPIGPLLRTFNLLRAFPSTSPAYFRCKVLCDRIIDIFLLYTQPLSEQVNEKDSLSKTLWTLVCGEVIKFINYAPFCSISGLLILSELLPLPLPIQTCKPLTNEEITWCINLRKLWSAHLHAFSSNIQEFIIRECTSTHQPLLNLLKKVCIQLADLAANSAMTVARGILDALHEVLSSEEEKQSCKENTARLLNFLACLVTHNSIKSTVLHLICSNSNMPKYEEKYPELIKAFAQILSSSSSTSHHTQAQECILSIIQSFCDSEITMLQKTENVTSDVYLSNSLPTKETLIAFISIIMDHLMAENSFITYLPIMRTLLLLTEHDYGFYYLKETLMQRSDPFRNVLQKIDENISKENTESISALNSLLEFLRMSRTVENVSETMPFKPRTMKLSSTDFKNLIGWKTVEGEENEDHLLLKLEKKLTAISNEDDSFKHAVDSINDIKQFLNGDPSDEVTVIEPSLPLPISPLMQFASRMVYTSDVIFDQLTSAYWLSVPLEGENETENGVTCDISEISRQHLSNDVSLIKEVEKLCRIYTSNASLTKDSSTKDGNAQKTKIKKPFAVTSRRGFPRTIQARGDLFRSRPPNTSRPPSLHVDDFVALETCGAQPTGPTGYNKVSRDLVASCHTSRSTRGRTFMSSESSLHYRQMSWWCTGLSRSSY